MLFWKLLFTYKLWKFKRQYLVDGVLPSKLEIFFIFVRYFGPMPIEYFKVTAPMLMSQNINLSSDSIFELRSLFVELKKGIDLDKPVSKLGKLTDLEWIIVKETSLANYFRIKDSNNVQEQKDCLLDIFRYVLEIEDYLDNCQIEDEYYLADIRSRALIIVSDFIDIYYALILKLTKV